MPKLLETKQVATCIGLLFAGAAPLHAAPQGGHIILSSLMLADEPTRWEGFTFLGQEVVESLNSSSSRGVEELDNMLQLDLASPLVRLMFLLTAGQAQTRFVWANSVLAHEYAHFQHAHGFGLTDHYFRDDKTGNKFGWQEAWLRIFLTGDAGGPATSREAEKQADEDYLASEGIRRTLSGLNWQMTYSEARLRSWLAGDRRSVFDAADFLLNRGYTLSYSLGSKLELNGGSVERGDPVKFSDHLEEHEGESDVLAKMVGFSLLANLLSPSVLTMASSFGPYVGEGVKSVAAPGIAQSSGGWLSWDIPQYLNDDNFSIVPTLYWRPSISQTSSIGAESVILGLGLETSVIGASHQELRLTLDGRWDRFEVGAGASLGPDGQYMDLRASYNLTDDLLLSSGGAARFGETMRADRDLPDAGGLGWFGLEYRF